MEIIRSIILGVVQGLTEFLPVSSSGHLELAKYILGDASAAEQSLAMTVLLHVATAFATVVVFWREIAQIFRGLFALQWNEETQFSAKIILSMIPAVVVGLLFEEEIESLFARNILLVAVSLLITGTLLLLAHYAKKSGKALSFSDALVVGIAQAIAITPGISRSGATIGASVLLGIDRTQAARFSFLMVIPLIFGKLAKDLLDGSYSQMESAFSLGLAFVCAFLTGILACRWMITVVRNSKLIYFAFYCFVVGTLALIYILSQG